MANKKDAKKELVPVRLFKDNERYKDDVTVGLNGKIYRIKRGETVLIPREVREILDHSEFQDIQTAKMITEMTTEFAEKSKNM